MSAERFSLFKCTCLTAVLAIVATSTAQAQVKLSQVYGAGGNTQAPLLNDYIEIYNAGAPQNLSGWSVQYAAATGTSWTVTALPAVVLGTGQYLLIQQSTGGTIGAGQVPTNPTAQATGTTAMSATDFKVALVSSTTALTTGTPTYAGNPTLVDFVGAGTANWNDLAAAGGTFAAANNAPPLSVAHAIYRAGCGGTDTNNSRADWAVGFPAPRNTSTPVNGGMSVIGTALPLTVEPGQSVRLTASPYLCGTLADGVGTTLTVDTTLIGGGLVAMTDDGLGADEAANDRVYTALVTVAGGTSTGTKSLPLAVNDSGGNSGGSYISIEIKPAATPDNDNCLGAQAVAVPSVTTATFTDATVESNPLATLAGPPTTGMTSRRGLWYSLVGTGNTITVDTCASPLIGGTTIPDTVMAVFCGSCDGMTAVHSNDDNATLCGSGSGTERRSRFSWCSQAGTTYYIWVAPFSTGAQTFTFTLTVADDGVACTTAFPCTMCTNNGGPYTETEPAYGPHTNDGCGSTPNFFTDIASPGTTPTVLRGESRGMIGNRDVDAYRFQAAATGTLTMTIDTKGTNAQAQLNSLSAGGACPQTSVVNTPLFVARCVSTIQTASASVTAGNWYVIQVVGGIGIQVTPAGTFFGGQMPGGTTFEYAVTVSITPSGACCLQDGSCQILTEAACNALPYSFYNGDNTTCPPTPPCPAGACCLPDGSCVQRNSAACAGLGGCYQGDGVPCGSGATTYSSAPAVAIPDNNPTGVSTTINVPDSYLIGDLNVELIINHTWQGDLKMTLTGPGGSPTIILVDRPGVPQSTLGFSNDNYGNSTTLVPFVLDDGATTTYDVPAVASPGVANVTGSWKPDPGPLSVFNGTNVGGTWTLTVIDNAGGDTGSIVRWALVATSADSLACPVIYQQPAPQIACEGDDVVFSVVAGGASASYDWRKGGMSLGAPNLPTLTLNNVTPADAGSYDVVITSGLCSLTSSAATLTVNPNPDCTITADAEVCADTSGHVASVADAGPGATYAWVVTGGTLESGQGTNSISYTAGSGPTVTIDVTVTDGNGCTCTGQHVVTVNANPDCTITADAEVCADTSGHAASVADAGPGATYAWVVTGGTLESGQGTNSISYTAGSGPTVTIDVTVTDGNGCTCTGQHVVTVNPQPAAPDSVGSDRDNLCMDDGGQITLTAVGGSGDTLEWFTDSCGGTALGTGNPLMIAAPTMTTTYYARWTNACGTSACASVTVTVLNKVQPTIDTQPTAPPVPPCEDGSVTMTVVASGGSLSYQWRKNGMDIGGATSASYTIDPVLPGDAGSYTVVVSNVCGSVESDAVIISVGLKCDSNCDGFINVLDVNHFIQAIADPAQYIIDHPSCDLLCHNDINRDGNVDILDINPFVACVLGP